jgi:2,4'-dihydroxyacetophenone dioxygenase
MTTTPMLFDDRNINWQPLGDFKHFTVAVYQVDEARKIVDFILKYEPNERIVTHRHLAQTSTLVIQGEHRLYEPNGVLKEVRPVGGYTASPPAEPHSEGGGPEGAVIFYSLRADDDRLFELYDDEMKSIAILRIADFADVQRANAAMKPVAK